MAEYSIWHLLVVAVAFTLLGRYWKVEDTKDFGTRLIQGTIDGLVEQGYIKHCRDNEGELNLLKWWEEYPKEVDADAK
jgi:hypothetical protein